MKERVKLGTIKKCKRCGTEFKIRSATHQFCSKECCYLFNLKRTRKKPSREKYEKDSWVLDMENWQWREKNGSI